MLTALKIMKESENRQLTTIDNELETSYKTLAFQVAVYEEYSPVF